MYRHTLRAARAFTAKILVQKACNSSWAGLPVLAVLRTTIFGTTLPDGLEKTFVQWTELVSKYSTSFLRRMLISDHVSWQPEALYGSSPSLQPVPVFTVIGNPVPSAQAGRARGWMSPADRPENARIGLSSAYKGQRAPVCERYRF